MAVVVEHDKRKKKILEKALDLFVEEGYEDVTYQKIADRCGITRTTLYIYFKNKREIFMYSLKQLTDSTEDLIRSTIDRMDLTYPEKLKKIFMDLKDCCIQNKKLYSMVLIYLLQIQKTGKYPGEKVRRRIMKMRHLVSAILIDGKKCGQFKDIDIKAANEVFYGLMESVVFRLTILDQNDIPDFERMLALAVNGIVA
ncbi:MAG: TetR/AcrR family transcriptional regulator [Treponemataceae bacterium]